MRQEIKQHTKSKIRERSKIAKDAIKHNCLKSKRALKIVDGGGLLKKNEMTK
jgi:hypothetical protein